MSDLRGCRAVSLSEQASQRTCGFMFEPNAMYHTFSGPGSSAREEARGALLLA